MKTLEREASLRVNEAFVEYYRCPEECASFELEGNVHDHASFFRFGGELTCFGRTVHTLSRITRNGELPDMDGSVRTESQCYMLPFDPTEVVTNLRRERYVSSAPVDGLKARLKKLKRDAYYLMRPHIGVTIRKYLQRASLRGWEKKPFPSWPVDLTVDRLFEKLMTRQLTVRREERIPFIWFWPAGCLNCVIMTHDVEEESGLNFCRALVDLDSAFGLRSSFQFIPEGRYGTPPDLLDQIRGMGFEVNIHDLNHDGHLYDGKEEFLRRAAAINRHAKEFGARGFRSGVLYRNLEWYDALEFAYDMSVPNVGHMDPQPGGCCTVMPYLIGKILEIPLTTTQDYSIFKVMDDFSIDLWKKQIALIAENHGLISFNIHPDYVIEKKARDTYQALLAFLSAWRTRNQVWFALPSEVNRWWRDRRQMRLEAAENGAWQIEGPGKERARIAYAQLNGEGITYSIEGPAESAQDNRDESE